MTEINIDLGDIKKTQEQEEVYEIAGFNERFLAYLIDTLPFVFLHSFTLTFAIKNNYIIYNPSIEKIWKIIWIALFIIYEIIFTYGGRRTLGKKIIGIKVIDKNGKDVNIAKALIRVIGYFISAYTLNLGYIIAAFNRQRITFHDLIASTRVIRTKEKSDFMHGFILVVSWSLMAFFVANWANRTILKITPSEQKQINEAKRTLMKLSQLEEIHYRKFGFYTNDIKRLAELTGNTKAVRYEISKTITEGSLELASNGKMYIITAKAKNWRKTQVEVSGGNLKREE